MPKVDPEHTAARRRQIIDAAYHCFARKGFHQTTMRDIYEEANLSPGAVYHYFEGKDEIIAASFEFDYDRSIARFDAARDSDDPLGSLVGLLDFLFRGLQGAAAMGAGRVNVQGWGEALISPSLHDAVSGVLAVYRGATSEIIRRAQGRGQLDLALDAAALANALISLYYGLELQLALDPALDVDGYARAVRALLAANRSSSNGR